MRSYNNLNFLTTYRSIIRQVVLDKLLVSNSYACPTIRSGALFLELRNLDSFDTSRLVAASFLLKILTNRRPYVTRFSLFQTFHNKNYDVSVRVDLRGTALFEFIKILVSDILPFLSKLDVEKQVVAGYLKGSLVSFTIHDLSFMRVIETHSVFFKWRDKVCIKLFFSNRCAVKYINVLTDALRL